MRLFKRKKKEERKLGWNDLTLTDLMQIKSIIQKKEEGGKEAGVE